MLPTPGKGRVAYTAVKRGRLVGLNPSKRPYDGEVHQWLSARKAMCGTYGKNRLMKKLGRGKVTCQRCAGMKGLV
jgi:hypothetical protein